MLFKLSELRVAAFTKFAKESEKTIVTLWILSTKNLFLTAQSGGYHFILVCQECFKCTQLHIHTSCPSTSQMLFWNIFFEILWANSVEDICNNFWLLLMSKFGILRSPKHYLVSLYRVSPLWRQGFNRDKQMYIPSQVKSVLRKPMDWKKARVVTVYYSCQMYLYCTSLVLYIWPNGPLYLTNSNALTRFLRLPTTEWENVEPCESYLLERYVSVDEAKLFDQYQNLFEFVQTEHQPNAIYCKMMEHERWAKYSGTCNTIEYFSELIKIVQFYFSVMAHYANVERFFPWCSHKPKRKKNLSNWTSFYSSKAGVKFKTCFMQLVSWYS